MNVASKELCHKLSELSDWEETEFYYLGDALINRTPRMSDLVLENMKPEDCSPAYDLSYLLRKLPEQIELKSFFDGSWDCRHIETDEAWGANGRINSDTPEDAAAKLAIELFKQGILTKENNE